MNKGQQKILLAAFIANNQKEIIEALIKDTDAWAERDSPEGDSAKYRLLNAQPEFDSYLNEEGHEEDCHVVLRDGQDNNIFFYLNLLDAFNGAYLTYLPELKPLNKINHIIIQSLDLFVVFV